MLSRLRRLARSLKGRIAFYRRVAAHPRTPRLGRLLLLAALAYTLSPIDLIPDFIPLTGHLDDLIIVPALIALALWLIPRDVVAECREGTVRPTASDPPVAPVS